MRYMVTFLKRYKTAFLVLVIINIVRHGDFSIPALIGGALEGALLSGLFLIGWGAVTGKLGDNQEGPKMKN